MGLGFCVLVLPVVIGGARPVPPDASRLIEPPFVRKWTAHTGEQTEVVAVRDGVVYWRSNDGVGAIDIDTGKPRWHALAGRQVTHATLGDGVIYAVASLDKRGELVELALPTGSVRDLRKLPNEIERIAADGSAVYVLDRAATLLSLDSARGGERWSKRLERTTKEPLYGTQMAVADHAIYVATNEGELSMAAKPMPGREVVFDADSGALLWQRRDRFASSQAPVVVGSDLITQGERVRRTAIRTGRAIWNLPLSFGDLQVVAGVLVGGSNDGRLVGRDAATGRVAWSLPLRDPTHSYGGDHGRPPITDGERLWVERDPVLCVTTAGREVWAVSSPYTGAPIHADATRLTTTDGRRILGYVHGTLPRISEAAAAREDAARDLIDRFADLDDAERQLLGGLGPQVFRSLIVRYVSWAHQYDAAGRGAARQSPRALLNAATPVLSATFGAGDTAAALKAAEALSAQSVWRSTLEEILQNKGDAALLIPAMLSRLRAEPAGDPGAAQALVSVARSSHPDAVQFMREALLNPKAPPEWRSEAFCHLAGTGGAEGAKAVLLVRAKRAPRRVWLKTVTVPAASGCGMFETAKDPHGRTWALFQSSALGNGSDLFIAPKTPTGWGGPVFTGIFTERTWHLQPTKSYRGVPVAKLLKGAWVRILSTDRTLTRDTDGDGLTDLVEARLGTDPRKADTDGEGAKDAVDPCPNAAPRKLGDDEKIISACVEARFFGQASDTPATITAGRIKPFELYGYAGTLMWEIGGKGLPLGRMYGGGMNTISFHGPDLEGKRDQPMIVYGRDRTTARTTIRRYSGGLNGDGYVVSLKKIGGEWFVVGMEMAYIS